MTNTLIEFVKRNIKNDMRFTSLDKNRIQKIKINSFTN
jgi:hypothetical protein